MTPAFINAFADYFGRQSHHLRRPQEKIFYLILLCFVINDDGPGIYHLLADKTVYLKCVGSCTYLKNFWLFALTQDIARSCRGAHHFGIHKKSLNFFA